MINYKVILTYARIVLQSKLVVGFFIGYIALSMPDILYNLRLAVLKPDVQYSTNETYSSVRIANSTADSLTNYSTYDKYYKPDTVFTPTTYNEIVLAIDSGIKGAYKLNFQDNSSVVVALIKDALVNKNGTLEFENKSKKVAVQFIRNDEEVYMYVR